MNSKIDWKAKLSSRKLWAMLAGQITAILTAFNASENVILQVTAVVASIGSLAVYMLAEAHVDGKREAESLPPNFSGTISETKTTSFFPDDGTIETVVETEVEADGDSTE